jgi:hypothetical protein
MRQGKGAPDMNIFKSFVTLPIDAKTGKRLEEPLKPDLDKVYVHPEYTLASNGHILLKVNERNDTADPYLECPKTKTRYEADEYPIKALLNCILYAENRINDEKIELTNRLVDELINVHMQAKICKHPLHTTTWGGGGFYTESEDKTCTFKYELPNPVRTFTYSADNMLKILRVVKRYKEGCTLYPKPLSLTLFTFAGHQAILAPIKT